MKYFTKKNNKGGFSFIELLVVLSIFGILTSITLYNYNDYENRSRFEQIVYNVAIAIRQTQNSGTSSVDYVLNDFNPDDIETVNPVGIRFEYEPSQSSFSSTLTLFRDTNKLGGNSFIFDKENDSIVDTVKIPELDSISGICEEISTTSCTKYSQSVTLFFKRPHPEPYLEGIANRINQGGGTSRGRGREFEPIAGVGNDACEDILSVACGNYRNNKGNNPPPPASPSPLEPSPQGIEIPGDPLEESGLISATPLAYPIRIQLYDKIRKETWAIRIEPAGLISIVSPKQ